MTSEELALILEQRRIFVGNVYIIGTIEYLLAQPSANHICLISLISGNRWRDPICVKDVSDISSAELLACLISPKSKTTPYIEFFANRTIK